MDFKIAIEKVIKEYPNQFGEFYNKIFEEAVKHSLPSPETRKLIKATMDNQDLILKTIDNLRADLCSRIDKSDKENCEQHAQIIARQDHTNGSIGRLKKSQLILRTVLATVFVVMAILGFMPERIYEIFKGFI